MRAAEEIDASFVPRAAAGVVVEELDGEAMLYQPTSGSLHALNGSAAAVWACLDGQTSVAEIADLLASVYDQPASTIDDDVLGCVRELGRQGLLAGIRPSAMVCAWEKSQQTT